MREARRHILFVEDHEDTSQMVALMLELEGYRVTQAHNLADGLALARGGNFDLYILDGKLPDGSGVELCRLIREFDSHTPILFYSASAYTFNIAEARAAGAQGYITKPADPDQLESSILRLLNGGCSDSAAKRPHSDL